MDESRTTNSVGILAGDDAVECVRSARVSAAPEVAGTALGRGIKRCVDVVGAGALLVVSAPVMIALAAWIRLHDGGPAIHRRRVIGPRGEFDAFKLRSMRVDADDMLRRDPELRRRFEVNYKLDPDPRVTPPGKILRRTNLDELPQLWNVLRGQMSMVGPRMITLPELKKYGDAGWIFQRVRPGLTGYWQIYGRDVVSYDRRVEMDLDYVKHWSLATDLKILLATTVKMVLGLIGL